MPGTREARVRQGGAGRGVWAAVRYVGRAWMQGWTAFVAATGEPHLSMAGPVSTRRVTAAADVPRSGGEVAEVDGGAPTERMRRSA